MIVVYIFEMSILCMFGDAIPVAESLGGSSEIGSDEPFALFAPEKANDFFEPIVLARLQSRGEWPQCF